MSQNQREQAQWVSTGNPETVDDSVAKLFAPGQVGKYLTIKAPGPSGPSVTGAGEGTSDTGRDKEYRYVQCDSTMTTAPFPGAVAWWSDKSRFKVTTSAALRGRRAGVFKGTPTFAAGNYCFIQTGGTSWVKAVDADVQAALVAGLFVIPSATAAKANVLASGTAATFPPLGYTVGVIEQGGVTARILVDLDIPDNP